MKNKGARVQGEDYIKGKGKRGKGSKKNQRRGINSLSRRRRNRTREIDQEEWRMSGEKILQKLYMGKDGLNTVPRNSFFARRAPGRKSHRSGGGKRGLEEKGNSLKN